MKYVWCVCLMLAAHTAWSQVDPHFSQYYAYPLWMNPGLTGAMDGNYRVNMIYRNQWNSIANAFSTAGVSADFTTNKDINFGINLMNQTAGNGGYRYTTAYASATYTGIRFGNNGYNQIAFGMQGGFINRRFDRSKLQYGDQWVPFVGYDPQHMTNDVFANPSSLQFDAATGVAYYNADPNRKANVFAGFSASHLTQPRDPFLSGDKKTLPIRYTIHGGVRLQMSETVDFIPNALYMRQGNAQETMVGGYVQIKADENTQLLLGGNYRFNDAIAPYAGLYFSNMTVGLSYDVNTSDLGKAVSGTHGFEVSVSFTGKRVNDDLNHWKCPRL